MFMKLVSIVLMFGIVGCGGASATWGVGGGGGGGGGEPPPAYGPQGGGPTGAATDPDMSTWTLEERQFWAKLQEEMDEFAKKANAHCGSQITAGYRKEAFRGKLTAGGNYGLPSDIRSRCTAALSAILNVCGDGEMAKQAVSAKINRVECDWGDAAYVVQNGTFFARINVDDDQVSNYQRPMEATLRKSL
jgi:hypothetical protein